MKSFGLIRTNPALTTNAKIVVTSTYDLYLETFNSVSDLANSRYKHFRINKDVFLDEVLPVFYKETATNIAFALKDDNDQDKMYNDFDQQFDDIYWSGCQEVPDTSYQEEFEAFAPLYINKQSLPTNFIIFRVDGPGLDVITKDNFSTNILDSFKVVQLFDLVSSPLGEFIKKNITNNNFFPETPLEIDVRNYEFSTWNGIDYETGGYASKSLFIEDFLEVANLFYYFDKTITDGYKNNKIIFPHIWNLTFLFDDTPATKTSLRKWTINRYYGFYLDNLDLISELTFWTPERLKTNIQIIDDNIIVDSDGNSNDPTVRGWNDTRYYYIEYLGKFYPLTRYFENDNYVYKITASVSLSGNQALVNKQVIKIDSNNYITYNSDYNSATFSISNFSDADVWIISINGKYHRLKQDSTGYFIYTDYGFTQTDISLEYYINAPDTTYNTKIDLSNIDKDNQPTSVKIFRLDFSDVKDLDNKISETEYARYEYELESNISNTEETKLYSLDYMLKKFPQQVETFKFNNMNTHIPVSSEYIASTELFVIDSSTKNLIELWKKNPNWLKWGYQNSNSSYDYTYRLNNSLLGEDFNRTTNIIHSTPIEIEKNLDYFYSVNAASSSYIFQSLHINGYTGSTYDIDSTFNFEIDKYFNYNYSGDYFLYFFGKKDYVAGGEIIKNTSKWSYLNEGDNDFPNSTVFRGIKFNLYDVKSIIKSENTIQTISLQPTNDFSDYKFSILLSSFDKDIDNSFTSSVNSLSWNIIQNFTTDNLYITGSNVLWNGILFESTAINQISDPNFNPSSASYWTFSSTSTVFWNPIQTYSANDVIYNSGDYWYRTGIVSLTASDLWDPTKIYASGSYVLHNAKLFQTSLSTSTEPAVNKHIWTSYDFIQTDNNWSLVQNWNSNITYNFGDIIVRDNIVYSALTTTIEDPSSISQSTWTRVYSFVPDTNFVYTDTSNNIIHTNNSYFLCTSTNTTNSTLDNGINIYINKKWKNILVNIYVNDNTTQSLSGVNRHDLYNNLNSKLTAKNLINCINDIENTYDFINNLNYYIIDEDLTFKKYDVSNIETCPYLMICEIPDELLIKLRSYSVNPNLLNLSLLKITNKLENNTINDISQLNYYNNGPLSFNYAKNENDIRIVENFSRIQNSNYANIYRFNGYYSPICYDINLFKHYDINDNLIGNYKFDPTLTDFGLVKQRIYSKVNLRGNELRLRLYRNEKSVYPMVDECGYSVNDFLAFRSTWDNNYYVSHSLKLNPTTNNAPNLPQ